MHIPLLDENGYDEYKTHRDTAFKMSIKQFELEMTLFCPINRLLLEHERLTVQPRSQSKLSQQELADLQKATHFDKKELQQWYKGKSLSTVPETFGARL
jgi:neuronal calcium sensor 1